MKSTLLLVISLTTMLVLSGCIVDPEEPATDSSVDPASDDAGGDADNNTTVKPSPESIPPEVDLSASNLSGEAPLLVVFNLSSTSSYAAYLDWSLDADGDGTADATGYGLPHDVEFEFEEVGNYTASLMATDPEGLEGNATLAITVVEAPPIELPEPIVFTGTATGLPELASGIDHLFNVTSDLNNMTLTFEVSAQGFDFDFYVYAPGAEEPTEKAAAPNDPTGILFHRVEPAIFIEKPVPGEWRLEVVPYFAVEAEYTVTITFG